MMRMWILLVLGLGLMAGCGTVDSTTNKPGADATVPVPDTVEPSDTDAVEPSDTDAVDTAEPGPCEGKTEGAACDDGDPCTLDDTCSAGACVGGSNDPCETDNPCEPGTCVAGEGCTYPVLQDETPCGDGLWCQDGECIDQQVCGNGNVEAPEACDDGEENGAGEGQCLDDCSAVQSCGDGIMNGSEACDDGPANESADGACLKDCTGLQICGDGEVAGSEDCDGPNCCGCTTDEANPNQCVLANTVGEFAGAKLPVGDGVAGADFGYSVSLSGDTLVVGARFDDDKGSGSGSVYVYVRSDGVWIEQQKLTADDGEPDDYFGQSVSISGDTLVVGAHYDDVEGVNSGSAYVYVRDGVVWTEEQKLTADDGETNDGFGYSVSLSGDTLVVGSLQDDDTGLNNGSAYVYVRTGVVWTKQQKLYGVGLVRGHGVASANFGVSVSLSGETLVVGADSQDIGTDNGTAYVYVRTGVVWTEQQKLTADDGAQNDHFGVSVSLSGETLVVGAWLDDDSGSAYVYVRDGVVWTQHQKLTADDGAQNDYFGFSVSISGDTLVVSARGDDDDDKGTNSGSAYVYVRNGNGVVWTEQQKLTADDGAQDDQFGWSVSISGDSLVVGAQFLDYSGSAYVFDLKPNCPTPDTCECKPGFVGPTCAGTE